MILDNQKHNSMVYKESRQLRSRDEALTQIYGRKYTNYRKKWCADITDKNSIPAFPMDYSLQLVDSCNMKCAICHSRKRTAQKLEGGVLRKVIIEGKDKGLCSVAIGLDTEALIDTNLLFETIHYCQEAEIMDIMIDTNGLLLSEELSQKIIQCGVTMVCISIDAATAETYKKIRHSDKFELVCNNVKNLVQKRDELNSTLPQIRISFCKTYVNKHEEQLFFDMWENIVDQIDIQNYISTVGELQDLASGKQIKSDFCKDPFRRVGILANGDVQCCCCSFGHKDIVIGNIYKTSMQEIWDGEKMKAIQHAFLDHTDNIPRYCRQCLNNRWEF